MKTVKKVVNPVKRTGEQSPGKIYDENLKVRRRREWRGVKDTFYDYTRWLYLVSVLARFITVPRNIKGFFRYRWMMSYLFVMHGMDKFTIQRYRKKPFTFRGTAMKRARTETRYSQRV